MGQIKHIPLQKDLIYDVGMHKGEDTDFYIKKGFRVVAFEADPDLIQINKNEFAREIVSKQLTIIEGAISEDSATQNIQFYKNLDKSVWGTIDPAWASRNEKLGTTHKILTVKSVDFGLCLERYGVPYYIKIDIEGADKICLQALLKVKQRPPYLSIESEKRSFYHLCREIKLLDEMGYNRFVAVQQGSIHRTKLKNSKGEGRIISYQFIPGSSGPFGRDLSGKWQSMEELIETYRLIFQRYKKYGDNTFWGQNRIAKTLLHLVSLLTGKPIPGWYDTHARHSSISS